MPQLSVNYDRRPMFEVVFKLSPKVRYKKTFNIFYINVLVFIHCFKNVFWCYRNLSFFFFIHFTVGSKMQNIYKTGWLRTNVMAGELIIFSIVSVSMKFIKLLKSRWISNSKLVILCRYLYCQQISLLDFKVKKQI